MGKVSLKLVKNCCFWARVAFFAGLPFLNLVSTLGIFLMEFRTENICHDLLDSEIYLSLLAYSLLDQLAWLFRIISDGFIYSVELKSNFSTTYNKIHIPFNRLACRMELSFKEYLSFLMILKSLFQFVLSLLIFFSSIRFNQSDWFFFEVPAPIRLHFPFLNC